MRLSLESIRTEAAAWRATREACSLPLPTGGRPVYNWKLCHRD